jgi:hypothetical protein
VSKRTETSVVVLLPGGFKITMTPKAAAKAKEDPEWFKALVAQMTGAHEPHNSAGE